MKAPILLAAGLLFVALPSGCGPAPPTGALRRFEMRNVGGLEGGFDLYVDRDGKAFARVVRPPGAGESGMQQEVWQHADGTRFAAEIERASRSARMDSQVQPSRTPVPDEVHVQVTEERDPGGKFQFAWFSGDSDRDRKTFLEDAARVVDAIRKEGQKSGAGEADPRWRPPGW